MFQCRCRYDVATTRFEYRFGARSHATRSDFATDSSFREQLFWECTTSVSVQTQFLVAACALCLLLSDARARRQFAAAATAFVRSLACSKVGGSWVTSLTRPCCCRRRRLGVDVCARLHRRRYIPLHLH
eukprot:9059286-Pyramimonas_sp.AAC.1